MLIFGLILEETMTLLFFFKRGHDGSVCWPTFRLDYYEHAFILNELTELLFAAYRMNVIYCIDIFQIE